MNKEEKSNIIMEICKNQELIFYGGGKELIRLSEDGDILIEGRLADNDKEVVNAMRDFISSLE